MGKFTDRISLITGEEAINALSSSHVLICGVGGVGAAALEALVRGGVGRISIVDMDIVDITNINRQIIAFNDNIGMPKTDEAKKLAERINPNVKINAIQMKVDENTIDSFDFSEYDYVIDAIDSVSCKVLLIEEVKRSNVPIISAMGAGNKLDPTKFTVSDIYETSVCPLAKVIRKKMREKNIDSLKVVYSKEEPRINSRPPGSMSYVPPVMGYIMAGEVIKDLAKI